MDGLHSLLSRFLLEFIYLGPLTFLLSGRYRDVNCCLKIEMVQRPIIAFESLPVCCVADHGESVIE